ncbi:MAG TPA: hypothetical protein DEH78_31805, partial [Solibacterales bacterium]|nr:hypothetical protein [Bryobacterales bacterium]
MRFLTLAVSFAAPALLAQSTSGSLTGLVVDASRAAVPEATVKITNTGTGVITRTASNEAGAYAFPNLPAGEYRLTAEKQGFRVLALNAVHIEVGARVALDLQLEVGATAEVVEVSAQADSPLSYVTPTLGGVITERKVLDLPVSSRNVLNLTTTMPGTNGANFNGARRGNLNVQMDGINVMDARINLGVNSTIFASVDRVAEFRVVTQPVDAELGRGSGQVQMITRSGTNEFHGSVFNFHRNNALNANNWFNNLNNVPRERLIRNQYGARVGGPILKNRTFFHFLWEGQKIRGADTVNTTVWTSAMRRGQYRFFPNVQNGNANALRPTVDVNGEPLAPAAGAQLSTINIFNVDPQRAGFDRTGLVQKYIEAMPQPNNFRGGDGLNTAFYTWNRPNSFDENNFNLKVDHNLTDRHRLSFSWSNERSNELNGFMPQNYPGLGEDLIQQRDSLFQGTLTSTLSPTVVNEFRAGALRPRFRFFSPWEVDPSIVATTGGTPFGVDFGTISDPINIANDPQGRISPNYQFFNKTSIIRGNHNYKIGAQVWFVSTVGFNSFDVLPRAVIGAGGVPVANFPNVPGIGPNQAGAQNILNDLNGSVTNFRQALNAPGGPDPQYLAGEPKQRSWKAPEFAFFFQDDWKVSRRLTLNLGLRYEFYGVPYDPNGKTVGLVGGSQGIFGISGTDFGSLFRPGASDGALTQYRGIGPNTRNPGAQIYNNDLNNFAPVVGLAWDIPGLGTKKTVLR